MTAYPLRPAAESDCAAGRQTMIAMDAWSVPCPRRPLAIVVLQCCDQDDDIHLPFCEEHAIEINTALGGPDLVGMRERARTASQN